MFLLLSDGSGDYYVGGTDMDVDGVWRWIADNSILTSYTDTGRKQCLEMNPETLQWEDSGCNASIQKFVCEIMLP